MPITEDWQKVIVAGGFGMLGTLVPVFIAWTHDRDVNATRLRKLDEAIKRVAFWDQWLKLSIQIADPTDADAIKRIEKELALLGRVLETDSFNFHEEIDKQQVKATQFKKVRGGLPFWRKWFLLYVPERSLAWFPRILFYLALPVFLFILEVFHHMKTDRSAVIGTVFVEFILIVWMIVFRSLSRWLEQPRASHSPISEEFSPSTPPQPIPQ